MQFGCRFSFTMWMQKNDILSIKTLWKQFCHPLTTQSNHCALIGSTVFNSVDNTLQKSKGPAFDIMQFHRVVKNAKTVKNCLHMPEIGNSNMAEKVCSCLEQKKQEKSKRTFFVLQYYLVFHVASINKYEIIS